MHLQAQVRPRGPVGILFCRCAIMLAVLWNVLELTMPFQHCSSCALLPLPRCLCLAASYTLLQVMSEVRAMLGHAVHPEEPLMAAGLDSRGGMELRRALAESLGMQASRQQDIAVGSRMHGYLVCHPGCGLEQNAACSPAPLATARHYWPRLPETSRAPLLSCSCLSPCSTTTSLWPPW